jgi:hypothetical protein
VVEPERSRSRTAASAASRPTKPGLRGPTFHTAGSTPGSRGPLSPRPVSAPAMPRPCPGRETAAPRPDAAGPAPPKAAAAPPRLRRRRTAPPAATAATAAAAHTVPPAPAPADAPAIVVLDQRRRPLVAGIAAVGEVRRRQQRDHPVGRVHRGVHPGDEVVPGRPVPGVQLHRAPGLPQMPGHPLSPPTVRTGVADEEVNHTSIPAHPRRSKNDPKSRTYRSRSPAAGPDPPAEVLAS